MSIENVVKGLRESWVARGSFFTTAVSPHDPEVAAKTTRVSGGSCGVFIQAFLPHVNSTVVAERSPQWACVPGRCL